MMKHVRKNLFVVLVIAAVCFILSPTAHAGSLNPPGVPGSTMKPLDEVEPRIAINQTNTPGDSTATYIISQPGSYYLTENFTSNFKHGILINADDVTVDLMGYRLYSSWAQAGNLDFDGIYIAAEKKNIEIRNGTIQSRYGSSGIVFYKGFRNGIYADVNSENVRVLNMQVFRARENGIYLRDDSVVQNCTANYNGTSSNEIYAFGICVHDNSSISNCVANYNGESADRVMGIGTGKNGIISNCIANDNGKSASDNVWGISVSEGSRVTGCIVKKNGELATGDCVYGIEAGIISAVNNNTVNYNGFQSSASQYIYGIVVGDGCSVKGNTVGFNGREATSLLPYTSGIYANGVCTVIGNNAYFNGHDAATEKDVYGLRIGSYGLVDENTSFGHGDNLHALPGCTMGTNQY